jgi:hypothetical protein
MNNSPTVSVIMPVYNAERYVAQAIESILAQTFTDFEFIIIDDGSTDSSLKILQKYAAKDTRIKLISRENKGFVPTLNEMLSQAKGEFIARMDADDIAMPERFAHQVEFLQRQPQVVCLGGSQEWIDEADNLLAVCEAAEHNDYIQQLALAGHTPINHPSAMIRRTAILAVGGYEQQLEPSEDLDLWLKLGEIGELANLKEVVVKYRLHSQSVSEAKQSLQNKMKKIACERAWQRRGIEGHFEATKPWRAESGRSSQHQFLLTYGWWVFKGGQRKAAMSYALRAIATLPFNRAGWTLLACAFLKPLPNSPVVIKPKLRPS